VNRWTARTPTLIAAAVLWAVAFLTAQHAQFTGRVVAVIDGDTIGVLRDGREVRVRLEGIDAPEDGQDFSQRANQFTSQALFGKDVTVSVKETDQYGRLVSRVLHDGRDISVALVEAGLAWHYVEYSNDFVLRNAETSARQRRVGLWSSPQPTPPWAYRNERSAPTAQAPAVPPTTATATVYFGNTRSNVLHAPNCPSLKTCKYCTARFESVAAAVRAGYRPHGGRGGCIRD
jgi:endonuclease YncB( thermonuclease family)